MTREQLSLYINDSSQLFQLNYEELKSLVMQFPYATNLRFLLYEKGVLENHKDAERSLQMAATYTTDRKQLYHFVQQLLQLDTPYKIKQTETEVLELAALSEIEKMRTERAALRLETTLNTSESKNTAALELPLLNAVTDEKKDFTETLPLLVLPNDTLNTPNALINLGDLEKNNYFSDDNALQIMSLLPESLNEDLNAMPTVNAAENTVNYPEIIVPSPMPSNKIVIEKKPVITFEITNEGIKNSTNTALEDLTAQEKSSFTEWLNQFRAFSKVGNEPTETKIETPVEKAIAVEAKKSLIENGDIPEGYAEPIVGKLINDDLMAQMFGEANSVSDSLFFPTSPTEDVNLSTYLNEELDDYDHEEATPINSPEAQTPSNAPKRPREMHTLAVKSIADDDDVTSETLAHLLVLQGNYKKAISMYKKLSLQNPDKMHFFAEKIRELMND